VVEIIINLDFLCSAVSLSSSEGTNLDERSDPYQICVDLSASPSGGDLTVSFSSIGNAACKSDVKPCKKVYYLDL
jgi:hypothetical protein